MINLDRWGRTNCDEFAIITMTDQLLIGKKGNLYIQKSSNPDFDGIELQTQEEAIDYLKCLLSEGTSNRSIFHNKLAETLAQYYNDKIPIEELKETIEKLHQDFKNNSKAS